METLASSGYRAVAWDMPGYGHSAPIEPYNFKGLAQSCISLIESLQCGDVTLLGHSMGGMVAQEVVARRPELVSKLILCGTSPSFGKPDGDWQREFIAQRTAPLDAGKSMARPGGDAGAADGGAGLAARRRAAGHALHGPGAGRHLPARAGGDASPSTAAPTCR